MQEKFGILTFIADISSLVLRLLSSNMNRLLRPILLAFYTVYVYHAMESSVVRNTCLCPMFLLHGYKTVRSGPIHLTQAFGVSYPHPLYSPGTLRWIRKHQVLFRF